MHHDSSIQQCIIPVDLAMSALPSSAVSWVMNPQLRSHTGTRWLTLIDTPKAASPQQRPYLNLLLVQSTQSPQSPMLQQMALHVCVHCRRAWGHRWSAKHRRSLALHGGESVSGNPFEDWGTFAGLSRPCSTRVARLTSSAGWCSLWHHRW